MKSHTFTNHDILKAPKAISKGLLSFIVEQRYPKYNKAKKFNEAITNSEINADIEKDINRLPNLFIQRPNLPTINIVETLRTILTKNVLSALDLCEYLQSEYKLSVAQANYIIMSSTQAGIGGGYILSPSLINNKVKPDPTYLINRPGLMSKIIIDNEKNVKYIGGQIMLFDRSLVEYSEALNKGIGIENYLALRSDNKFIVYITGELGKLEESFTKIPKVTFEVAGSGSLGTKIVKQLQKIKTKCLPCDPTLIINDYIEFSEDIYIITNKMLSRYEYLISPLHDRILNPLYDIDLNEPTDEESIAVSTSAYSNNNAINPSIVNSGEFGAQSDEVQPVGDRQAGSNKLTNFSSIEYDANSRGNYSIIAPSQAENKPQLEDKVSSNLINTINELMQIVCKIVSCTTVNDDIIKLQEIFTVHYKDSHTMNTFINRLNAGLNDNQLHKLNSTIMQTMHILLPLEDKQCLLRDNEHKIFHKLLLVEAKRQGMKVELPDNINNLTIPEIPQAILAHYTTLTETFYNQAERQSDAPLDQRMAQSIHWLFFNPLIQDEMQPSQEKIELITKLCKVNGEYTKLLEAANMSHKVSSQIRDANPNDLLSQQQVQKDSNNIMKMFVPKLANLITIEILQKSIMGNPNLTNNQKCKLTIKEPVNSYLTMSCDTQILLDNSQLLVDMISTFLTKLTSYKKNDKTLPLFLSTISAIVSNKDFKTKKDRSDLPNKDNLDNITQAQGNIDPMGHQDHFYDALDYVV